MSTASRRASEKAGVREKILDAARDLFIRHGYDAVSMRKIAQAIDYTAAALYVHFEDKNELMQELCRRDFGRFGLALVKLRKTPDPVKRMAAFGRAYIRFAMEHPNQYRLMFMTPHPSEMEAAPEDLAQKDDPETNGYASFRESVAEALKAGKFRVELKDAELITQVFWAGVHGVVSLQITHANDPFIEWRSLEKRCVTMIDALILGMLTPAAAKEYRR